MKPEKVVLCASSKYEQKFYLNEEFKGLPEEIKKELTTGDGLRLIGKNRIK